MKEALEYDVVVIGAGIAGMVSAVTANGLGRKVAIVEKRSFGGNCSSYTCLPNKTLIRAGQAARLLHDLEHHGLRNLQPVALDTAGLMSKVKAVIAEAALKDAAGTFEKIGINSIIGTAEFVDSHHIMVNGQIITGSRFIIATGTRPLVPPIKGLQDIKYLTNETLYDLESLPKSMIILGGGVDGLEFASALGRLGVEITIVEMSARLLTNDDRELVNSLLEQLQNDGIRIMSGTKASSFTNSGGRIALEIEYPDGKSGKLEADSVLLTIGRKADLDGLKLEKAGVKFTPRGIMVNRHMQTSVPDIYACGDIAGPVQLASTAEYQGIIAATNAFLPVKRQPDYSGLAYVIFSEPPLARLGLTEEQARQKYGDDINVYRFDYSNMRRAMVDGTESGLAKIISDRKGHLLGAHILGESAPEVIHELQLIRSFNIPLQAIQSVTHAYPTYSQAIVGRAGQLAYLDSMNSNFFVKQFLTRFPGFHNRLDIAKQRLAEIQEPSLSADLNPKTPVQAAKDRQLVTGESEVNIIRLEPDIGLVELPPELNFPDETALLHRSAPAQAGQAGYLLLDFQAVRYISGLGASMLVKLITLAGRRKQKTLACGVNSHYREVLKITGLDTVMAVFDSREAALASLKYSGNKTAASPTAAPSLDINFWAKPVARLSVPAMPAEAINRNMNGLGIAGPVDGFGPLWQKTYRLIIDKPGITPEEAILTLKQNFPRFQPSFNHFYPTSKGLQPGEVVAIDSSTPGGPVSTGVMVIYADATSFTLITPQGHPESGWVTFSSSREGPSTVVQIIGLARANDPIYEAAFRAIGSQMQVRIWKHVLTSLATYLGVPAEVTTKALLVDPGMHWNQATNVWYNAQIRTLMYMPFRWIGRMVKNKPVKKD
jgi:pyruvate/2-oxoglutarate dehydrogenase complex dihydrolipoamide dehydrogenase (E3) component/anti-anti-sigma regulatory factor